MSLAVSIDGLVEFLAQQVFGNKTDDSKDMVEFAVDLALQEISASTQLVTQEAEGTLTLTGANSYNLSSIDKNLLRVHKAWTSWGDIQVMRKAEFVARYPGYANYGVGIPRFVVLWGKDALYVWPDQSSQTLNVLYYKMLKAEHTGEVLFALKQLAQKYVESDKDVRALNYTMAKDSMQILQKTKARASDAPIRMLPEERVSAINHHKRTRRWPRP